jgi:Acetyltransferase (GNAT) domain
MASHDLLPAPCDFICHYEIRSNALPQLGVMGVIRACRTGFKIGPLFADGDEEADLLFRALAGTANGELVFLDCPEPNRPATDRVGFAPVPDLSLLRTYGITTFELG